MRMRAELCLAVSAELHVRVNDVLPPVNQRGQTRELDIGTGNPFPLLLNESRHGLVVGVQEASQGYLCAC